MVLLWDSPDTTHYRMTTGSVQDEYRMTTGFIREVYDKRKAKPDHRAGAWAVGRCGFPAGAQQRDEAR